MKEITSITTTTEAPSSSANVYIEDGGNFRRSSVAHMKSTLGVDAANEAIDGESERAQNVETGLSKRISQNATDISAEASRAEAKESELSGLISANATAINTEQSRAQEAESTLTTNLASEVKRATAAEEGNAASIETVQTSLNNLWAIVHTW